MGKMARAFEKVLNPDRVQEKKKMHSPQWTRLKGFLGTFILIAFMGTLSFYLASLFNQGGVFWFFIEAILLYTTRP